MVDVLICCRCNNAIGSKVVCGNAYLAVIQCGPPGREMGAAEADIGLVHEQACIIGMRALPPLASPLLPARLACPHLAPATL